MWTRELLAAFRGGMLAATVGPVTAAPLLELGIEPLVPERFRMGAMLKQLTDALSGVQPDDDGR